MPAPTDQFKPGQRVIVTQQIPQRDDNWAIRVEGSVVNYEQRKTGSWYAHAKDDRLWLDRLVLRKDDGEIVVCNLDRYTRVEEVAPPSDASAARAIDYNKDHVQPPSGYQSLEHDGGDSSAGLR